MMKRSIKIFRVLFISFCLLLIPIVLALVFFLKSATGLLWTLNYAQQYFPGQLQVGKTSAGLLSKQLELNDIVYQHQDLTVQIPSLKLDWHPLELIFSRIAIEQLTAQQITINQQTYGLNAKINGTLKKLLLKADLFKQADSYHIHLDTTISNIDKIKRFKATGFAHTTPSRIKTHFTLKPKGKIWHLQTTRGIFYTEKNVPINWQGNWSWQQEQQNLKATIEFPEHQAKLDGSSHFVAPAWTTEANFTRAAIDDWPAVNTMLKSVYNPSNNQINVKLISAENTVSLEGIANESGPLTLILNTPKLKQLWPTFTGELKGKVDYSTLKKESNWRANISGNELDLGFLKAQTLQINADLEQNSTEGSLNFSATTLQTASMLWDKINFSSTGNRQQQSWHLALNNDNYNLNFNGISKTLAQTPWQIHLNTADIAAKNLTPLTLLKPTQFNIEAGQVSMTDDLCFHTVDKIGKLCTRGQYTSSNDWHVDANINHLTTKNLQVWLPADLKTTGDLNAKFNLSTHPKFGEKGDLLITLSPGEINTRIANQILKQRYQGGTLAAHWQDKQFIGKLNLDLWDNNHLDANWQMPVEFSNKFDATTQAINASLNAHFTDFSLVDRFIPSITHLQGKLNANIKVDGMLAEPRWQGELKINQGQAYVPRLNVWLKAIDLNANAEQHKDLIYQGTLKLGEGLLNVTGNTNLSSTGFHSKFNFKGNNLFISNTPETMMYASPDLSLDWHESKMELTGAITIPKATIKPRDFDQIQRVSDDVVFIDTVKKKEETEASFWNPLFYSTIDLRLGEKVYFDGFKLKGYIRGQLKVKSDPLKLTTATGDLILVDGQYTGFGETLDIVTGRLSYAGNTINNPSLLVKAEEKIHLLATDDSILPSEQGEDSNNSEGTTNVIHDQSGVVGVSISGTLKNPRMQLYSNPPMSDADKLSYLALGVPSKNASKAQAQVLFQLVNHLSDQMGSSSHQEIKQSIRSNFGLDEFGFTSETFTDPDDDIDPTQQTALTLGKSITPRIYVRYSIGLLDPISILRLQFKISDHWLLQTQTSTVGATGGDIIYNIETN